ncbi:Jlp2p Ecym_6066 [Eremothecium cymbalariae DBVPG|uniref:NFACT RNA-binding domain-containing protein n=1 Tax=Eremothecium cymbalariae (strain CBS 270.75 / DBVPG 7215 / KCTC 17166 / NRRL Y-17582) TaxID=931890 RepID=G8JUY7_ERECY|nr:hypothetical protein Ecym_6066 [Eremothecium cymbalariae DBVPG\
MVYFFRSQPDVFQTHYSIITGKDKHENDLLIKHGFRDLNYIWFHTDRYASGHIYLQLHANQKTIEEVPKEVIQDCLQLCKSESKEGNKLSQCTIIGTPWHNLRKAGYMKPGEVSFKSTKAVKKMECFGRDNQTLNKLKKSRVEIVNNVETLLHEAKRSKDREYLNKYVEDNRERLLEEENQRKLAKRKLKRH